MRLILAERDFRLSLVAWGGSMFGDFRGCGLSRARRFRRGDIRARLSSGAVAIEVSALFALVPRIEGKERAPRTSGLLEAARYAGLTVGTLTGGARP